MLHAHTTIPRASLDVYDRTDVRVHVFTTLREIAHLAL